MADLCKGRRLEDPGDTFASPYWVSIWPVQDKTSDNDENDYYSICTIKSFFRGSNMLSKMNEMIKRLSGFHRL